MPRFHRLFSLLTFAAIAAPTAASAAPRRVVIADRGGWSTTVVVASTGEPHTLLLTDCNDGPQLSVRLVPDGSAILRDAGQVQCDLRESFGLLPLDFDGLAQSRLTFRDGRATVSTLVVPSLDVPLDAAHPHVRMRLVANNLASEEGERTVLVVFGPPVSMKVYVYDGNNELIDIETIQRLDFDLQHDMLFYPLETELAIGTVILVPDRHDGTWYGFASVGPTNGTASEVRPWEASPPPHFLSSGSPSDLPAER